jgi:hypothetical protein
VGQKCQQSDIDSMSHTSIPPSLCDAMRCDATRRDPPMNQPIILVSALPHATSPTLIDCTQN